ncbi:MAG: hypothetical protein WBB27_15245 [Maribacter sp.]
MALQITQTRSMFSVFGELNSANANILSRHMQGFINPNSAVTLNLERVQAMDPSAAFTVEQMYCGAVRDNCILSVLGLGNTNILPVFKQTKTSYILSDDRI